MIHLDRWQFKFNLSNISTIFSYNWTEKKLWLASFWLRQKIIVLPNLKNLSIFCHQIYYYYIDHIIVIFLSNSKFLEYKAKTVSEFNALPTPSARNQFVLQQMKYFKLNDDTLVYPVTVWVVADFESDKGLNLITTALKSLVKFEFNEFRVFIVMIRYTVLCEFSLFIDICFMM